jgi:hypothetical protein
VSAWLWFNVPDASAYQTPKIPDCVGAEGQLAQFFDPDPGGSGLFADDLSSQPFRNTDFLAEASEHRPRQLLPDFPRKGKRHRPVTVDGRRRQVISWRNPPLASSVMQYRQVLCVEVSVAGQVREDKQAV